MRKIFKFKIFETYEGLTDFVNYKNIGMIEVVSVTENHDEIILWYKELAEEI